MDSAIALPPLRQLHAGEVGADYAALPFPAPSMPPRPPLPASLRPGVAVIVGVLTTVFFLILLLLLYAKHWKRSAAAYGAGGRGQFVLPSSAAAESERRHSGVERVVVESLPVFRFAALQGPKDGLECAVCLSRFEPAETLRLLPKCRHGFHVECVDTWLDAHSTCPLCRARVDPEDVLLLPGPVPPEPDHVAGSHKTRESKGGRGHAAAVSAPAARRYSGRHSTGSLQIVVHRAEPGGPRRTRRSADHADNVGGGKVGCFEMGKVRKDRLLLEARDEAEIERRCSHRIVVSSGGGNGDLDRWSDLRPSDLLFLLSETTMTESGRLSETRAGDREVNNNSRSLSEIAGLSRLPGPQAAGRAGPRRAGEERTMRRWLGFAAGREPARR